MNNLPALSWMKRFFVISIMFLIHFIVGRTVVQAQALITGENGGRGSQAIMVTANALFPKDYTVPANFWAQYGYGLANRIDVFASLGNITVYGKTQHYSAFGSNIGLIKRDRAGLDVSFYNNLSVPFNRQDQASTVLWNSAFVGSRPVQTSDRLITLYGGFSVLAPLGNRSDKIFTPPVTIYSGILGVALSLNKGVTLFFEYNPGSLQQSTGVGALYVLPRTLGQGPALI